MREIIEKILNEYVPAKNHPISGDPLGEYFRSKIPRMIYGTGIVDEHDYKITGSVGRGEWANVPWIGIFDRRITTSATKGVYIVYLLEKNGRSLYLTFMQTTHKVLPGHKIKRASSSSTVS